MRKKIMQYFLAVIILLTISQCVDRGHSPSQYTTELNYNLSDTDGVIKLGETLTVTFQLPNPLTSTTGETISYTNIKKMHIGFWCFIGMDTATCMQACYQLETKKGLGYDCDYGNDFDLKTGSWQVTFIPKDTGWTVFDCLQSVAKLTVQNGKDDIDVDIKYKFNAKSNISEMNAQYPCNKSESERKISIGFPYYAFKVVK